MKVQTRNRKLVDFFLNEVNAPYGVFDLDNVGTERIEAPLLELKPPPCTLTPVYEVCCTWWWKHLLLRFNQHIDRHMC